MKKLMESKRTRSRLLLTAVIVLSLLSGGCVTTVGAYGSYRQPHMLYTYYYYPAFHIYFDIASGYYWYQDHHHWKRVRRPPPYFDPHDHHRVFLRLDTDRPYKYHEQHRDRYREKPSKPGHWRDSGHAAGPYQAGTPSRSPGSEEQRRDDGHRDSGFKQFTPTRVSEEKVVPVYAPVNAESQRQDSHRPRPVDDRGVGHPSRAAPDKARDKPISTRGSIEGAHFPQRTDKRQAQHEKITYPRGQGISTDSRINKSAPDQKAVIGEHITNRPDDYPPVRDKRFNSSSMKADRPGGRKGVPVGINSNRKDSRQIESRNVRRSYIGAGYDEDR